MIKSATQFADRKRRKDAFQKHCVSAKARNRRVTIGKLVNTLDEARQLAHSLDFTDIGDDITDVMIALEEVTS